MTETELLRRLLLACTDRGARVFRNQVGMGWQGQIERAARSAVVSVDAGDVLIRQARPLRAGLCVGSSDIIGWKSELITPEMVGSRIARFAAIEAKSPRARLTEEQENFLNAVKEAGGIAIEARDLESILNL